MLVTGVAFRGHRSPLNTLFTTYTTHTLRHQPIRMFDLYISFFFVLALLSLIYVSPRFSFNDEYMAKFAKIFMGYSRAKYSIHCLGY